MKTTTPNIRKGKSGVGIYVNGRCRSLSPGNELQCLKEKGHDGDCFAKRRGPTTPGDPVCWTAPA
jgi:hypothetical protein